MLCIIAVFVGAMYLLFHQVHYTQQDVVEVNRILQTCENTWDNLNEIKLKESPLEFEVLNLQGQVLFVSWTTFTAIWSRNNRWIASENVG